MERWRVGEVSVQELWGLDVLASDCGGSNRTFITALGGWGNVPGEANDQFEVFWPEEEMSTLSVRWLHIAPTQIQASSKSGDDMDMSTPPTEW